MNVEMKTDKMGLIKGVHVFHWNLMHPTFLDIVKTALESEEFHGLDAIFFAEKKGLIKNKFGWYIPDINAIVINLPNMLNLTIRDMQKEELGLSINAAIWANMIWTFFHELHHAIAWTIDPELAMENAKGEEEEAEQYAEEMLNVIASEDKGEAPTLAELPWFCDKVGLILDRMLKAGENVEFVRKQLRMIDEKLVFDHEGTKLDTMKEYFEAAKEGEKEVEAIELELKAETTEDEKTEKTKPMKQMSLGYGDTEVIGEPGTSYSEEEGEAALALMPQPEPDTVDPFGVITQQPTEKKVTSLDEAYDHIAKDQADPNFHGIPGTSGTPSENIDPEEYRKHLENGGTAANFKPQGLSIRDAGIKMWKKVSDHIFNSCGYTSLPFTNLQAVETPIPIDADVANIGLITGSRNGHGGWIQANTGFVTGRYFKNGELPGYDIGVVQGGMRKVIRVMPQNPGTSSTYAARAKRGEKIAWVIDTSNNSWVGCIENGVYRSL